MQSEQSNHVSCFSSTFISSSNQQQKVMTNSMPWHRWDKNPLKNRETVKVPLMGRALEGIRRGNMMVTHLLMGFGKDHNPKNWWIFTPEEVWQKLYQTVGYCTTISHIFYEDVLLNVLCSCLHICTVHVKLSLNVSLLPLKQQHVALLSNTNMSLMLNCLYIT